MDVPKFVRAQCRTTCLKCKRRLTEKDVVAGVVWQDWQDDLRFACDVRCIACEKEMRLIFADDPVWEDIKRWLDRVARRKPRGRKAGEKPKVSAPSAPPLLPTNLEAAWKMVKETETADEFARLIGFWPEGTCSG